VRKPKGVDYFEIAHTSLRRADGNKDRAVELMAERLLADPALSAPILREQSEMYVFVADHECHSNEDIEEMIDPADIIHLGLTGEWPG
jgi:hypothetical protein